MPLPVRTFAQPGYGISLFPGGNVGSWTGPSPLNAFRGNMGVLHGLGWCWLLVGVALDRALRNLDSD